MKVSELTGADLDYWTGRTDGIPESDLAIVQHQRGDEMLCVRDGKRYAPSTDWAQGGPLIEREMIEISNEREWRESGEFGRVWEANHAGYGYMDGDTPLIAAMRAYVASKCGDEVPA